MAKKQCPVCGKAVAAQAQYCIYCAAKFDQLPPDIELKDISVSAKSGNKHSITLLVTIASLALIAVVALLMVFGAKTQWAPDRSEDTTTTTTAVTTTTRNAALDAARQEYIGYWYDEVSAGKRDLQRQGGFVLYIEEIFRDYVTFELLSYEGGEDGAIASASISKAVLQDDTLHFTFDNDTLGHAGEGFMRLAEDCIEMEVMIDDAESLPEDEHTLAVYAVFKRKSLPHSDGHNLQELDTLAKIKEVAGKETAAVAKDDAGNATYTFGSLKAVTNAKGELTRVIVDYASETDKAKYCYVCVDGTMTYDTIKTYFGEALHDYVERPTDIRVLYYAMDDQAKVKFTFDAENDLLISLDYTR